MITNVEDFVLNLLSGKDIIYKLYTGIDNAIKFRENGRQYYFTFHYPKYPTITYSALELMEIYQDSKSLYYLFGNLDNADNIIKIFLKVRPQLEKLYEAVDMARELNCNGRVFYYTFNNPFQGYIELDENYRIFKGDELLNLGDEAEKRRFQNFIYPIV